MIGRGMRRLKRKDREGGAKAGVEETEGFPGRS